MKSVVIVLVSVTLSIVGGMFLFKYNEKKLAYVDLTVVFSKFDYKKELEKKMLKVTETRKTIMDSLEFDLKLMAKQLESNKNPDKEKVVLFQVKREDFFKKKQEYAEDNSQMAKQYDEQIFKQLNQYIKEYGKMKSYSIIFGTDGTGTLMYGEEKIDVTNEATEFINNKYKGL
jgi:outer membrane protein